MRHREKVVKVERSTSILGSEDFSAININMANIERFCPRPIIARSSIDDVDVVVINARENLNKTREICSVIEVDGVILIEKSY